MSLKQGFVLGIGALAGGALGFYIQGRMMEKYRVKTEDFINEEVERRLQETTSTTTTKATSQTPTEPSTPTTKS